jgi:uncharacterized membrane protein
MRRLRFLLGHKLKTSLWLIPFACALAGIALSFVTVSIDRALPDGTIPQSITGDPNAALIILSTVAASMVSLTALVLTITSVVVQLAMGQFSPRSVRPFLQDRPSQFAIGVFVGAFAHAMFAMREVRSFTQNGSVPGVTILVSYALVFVSVVVLVAYVHHIANSLKVDSIIQSVGAETRRLLDKLYPDADSSSSIDEATGESIVTDQAGVVFRLDHEALVDAAATADVALTMTRGVGTFLPEGAPLFRVDGGAKRLDADAVRRAVAIGPERTMDQDGAYGIQTLVDIAERSLTDSFNDQTTAVQVVDRLHDILRSLATRTFPSGQYRDSRGTLRLSVPELGWEDYVGLAFDSVSLAGTNSPAVMRRIREALEDLRWVAPPERRPSIDSRLADLTDDDETAPGMKRASA